MPCQTQCGPKPIEGAMQTILVIFNNVHDLKTCTGKSDNFVKLGVFPSEYWFELTSVGFDGEKFAVTWCELLWPTFCISWSWSWRKVRYPIKEAFNQTIWCFVRIISIFPIFFFHFGKWNFRKRFIYCSCVTKNCALGLEYHVTQWKAQFFPNIHVQTSHPVNIIFYNNYTQEYSIKISTTEKSCISTFEKLS